MKPFDPMAVAVDWLDAYRAARINQIVGMHSPDAVIECACGGRKIIYGHEGIAAYWRDRFIEWPALELEDLQVDGRRSGCLLPNQQWDCSGTAGYCRRWADHSLRVWSYLSRCSSFAVAELGCCYLGERRFVTIRVLLF